MKKIILLSAFVFASFSGLKAQYEQENGYMYAGSNEIRLNALYLILGNLELSYEHLLNDYSGIGVTGNVNVDNNAFMDINYMFLPYYRLYTGEDADGLYFEGGLTFYNQNISRFNSVTSTTSQVNETSFGPCLSIGKKRVYNGGVSVEYFFGICRNFTNTFEGTLLVPRFGISLGKRF